MRTAKWVFLGVLALLVMGRLALPFIVKHKANAALQSLPDYKGHIDGIHLALWRGLCSLRDLSIEHKDGDFSLTIKELGIHVSWPHLLKRVVLADVDVKSPRLRFLVPKPVKAVKEVKDKAKDVDKDVKQKTGKSLPDLLASLMPFSIQNFHLSDGTLRIQESGQNLQTKIKKDKEAPKESGEGGEKEQALEARVADLDIVVKNLTNTAKISGTQEAAGRVKAKVMKAGEFSMDLKLNPVARTPTFDLDVALTEVNLVELNPVLRWQTGMDVNKGTFALFLEAAAREGGFKGYVKPFIHDLEMHDDRQDEGKNVGAKVKEAVVGAVAAILKNPKTKNVAARAPFEGRFDNPGVGIWEAIITVLRNGFIKALSPHFDRKE